jgi:hypothetical protein
MKVYLCRLVFTFTIYNIFGGIVMLALRHDNNPCTEEKFIQRIRWDVRIRFATTDRFKKTRGNDIFCSV